MSEDYKIPTLLNSVIRDLKYISGVGENQKLYFSRRIYVTNSELAPLTRLSRIMSGEHLENHVKIIKGIIDCAIECFDKFSSSCHFNNFIQDFSNARDGLLRLSSTYSCEGRSVVDLNTLIEIMNVRLRSDEGKGKRRIRLSTKDSLMNSSD